MPRTLLLMSTALIVGVFAGVALGTWPAARRGKPGLPNARRVRSPSPLLSIPEFLVALAALALPAARWHWFPVSGIVDPA